MGGHHHGHSHGGDDESHSHDHKVLIMLLRVSCIFEKLINIIIQEHNINLRAAALHVLGDLLASIGNTKKKKKMKYVRQKKTS